MGTTGQLPGLEEALDNLERIEGRYDEGNRIEQTRRALKRNAAIAANRTVVEGYYRDLAGKGMFVPIYGTGEYPWALPVHIPLYLIEILEATARVVLALMRDKLRKEGPGHLLDRVPAGLVSEKMAAWLHSHFLETEPDLTFDVLVHGMHSNRGIPFEEFLRSGDSLYASILEAQSVDTYYGWLRECIRSARASGGFGEARFSVPDAMGRTPTDDERDAGVLASYLYGAEKHPERICFLEIDPAGQATVQNLRFLARWMGEGNPGRESAIVDPADIFWEDGILHFRHKTGNGIVEKIISRLIDSELRTFVRDMKDSGREDVLEILQRASSSRSLCPDPAKHLVSEYLIDKSCLVDLSETGRVGIAPRTWYITETHLAEYREHPERLHSMVAKPLYGASAEGVGINPSLDAIEKTMAEDTCLGQELFGATPLMPNVNEEVGDPDARAGICSEIRLMMHGGSPAVAGHHRTSRCVLVVSRSHYSSSDPERTIRGDRSGRGWFSNIGAILAVKAELGLLHKRDAGLGHAPVCWVP